MLKFVIISLISFLTVHCKYEHILHFSLRDSTQNDLESIRNTSAKQFVRVPQNSCP